MKQEPVAWMWENDAWIGVNNFSEEKPSAYPKAIPLYTAPRELSDEEIREVAKKHLGHSMGLLNWHSFARAILKRASEK
jgi:hypothetical protein